MKAKAVFGSMMAFGLFGLGILAGSTLQAGSASAQAPTARYAAPVARNAAANSAPAARYAIYTGARTARFAARQAQAATTPEAGGSATTAITKAQAEAAANTASPGNTIDHTALVRDANGASVWDVDFTNGGGVTVNAQTGAIIAKEAAGTDKGGPKGGRGNGRADQAALAAQAKVTKAQAEAAANTASPGNTVAHSSLAKDSSGTIFWDVDFTNGGGVTVNAQTGAVIATEAAGTDKGGSRGGKSTTKP